MTVLFKNPALFDHAVSKPLLCNFSYPVVFFKCRRAQSLIIKFAKRKATCLPRLFIYLHDYYEVYITKINRIYYTVKRVLTIFSS